MDDEIWQVDATAQAELVRSGAVSPVELVEAALDRADELAELHCVTVLFGDRALKRADVATGPYAGVPILLKDAGQELAGTPMWMGSTALKQAGYVSKVTTELVGQLETLGFVIIGKATVPELMAGITTEPPTGPPTRNPWARDRTVGGSSGGSAAAVAAGIVALAHGSDSSGSLRFPASCCGVLTLKPSAGRISTRFPGGIPDPAQRHADFVLARSARDLRGTFAPLAGPYTDSPEPIKRVARLDRIPFGLSIDPLVHETMDAVADELVEVGLDVEPVSATFLERFGTVLGEVVATIADAHRAAVVSWIEAEIERPLAVDEISTANLEAAERGRRLEPDVVAGALAALCEAAQVAASWADGFDALLLPILEVPPWPNGTAGPTGHLGGLVCSLANFSGQPSAVIPSVGHGLPIGVQLQAPLGHDEALLDVLEAVRPMAPASPLLGA